MSVSPGAASRGSDGYNRQGAAEESPSISSMRRQGGRWAAAFFVERAVMRPTGRRHSGNAGRGSRRRAATDKLDAQAEATDLVVAG
jgi:hypothetical protein